MNFKKNGIRSAKFKFSEEDVNILKEDWQNFVTKKIIFPKKRFLGKGIVYTAGGIKYITCAWVSISLLRNLGCDLPIELWYLGDELTIDIINQFSPLNVKFRNFNEVGKTKLFGYMLKPLAIINSRFKEVLFLDADNNCVKNPEYLFSLKEYIDNGCIFWPDYFYTSRDNSIWKIINISPNKNLEQESGQILINKERCWKELQLCLHFNTLGMYYYNILLGDKDTFKFAWIALNSTFHMVKYYPGTCGFKDENKVNFYGNTMVQYDPLGDIIFLHKNLLKWDIIHENEYSWQYIKKFKNSSSRKEIVIRKEKGSWLGIDFHGELDEFYFNDLFPDLEAKCLSFLNELRCSEGYNRFCNHCYIRLHRPLGLDKKLNPL